MKLSDGCRNEYMHGPSKLSTPFTPLDSLFASMLPLPGCVGAPKLTLFSGMGNPRYGTSLVIPNFNLTAIKSFGYFYGSFVIEFNKVRQALLFCLNA